MKQHNRILLINRNELTDLLGSGGVMGPLTKGDIEKNAWSTERAVERCNRRAIKYARKKGYDVICSGSVSTGDFEARIEYEFYQLIHTSRRPLVLN